MQNNIKDYFKRLIKKLALFCQAIRNQSLLFLICLGFLFLILFWLFSDNDAGEVANEYEQNIEFEAAKDLDGVKESVDPRDMWVASVSEKIIESNQGLSEELEQKNADRQQDISSLKNEISDLKESLQMMEQKWLEEKNKLPPIDQMQEANIPYVEKKKLTKKFRHISNNNKKVNKDPKYYIPAGSFARGVLMTGVVVGTGTNNSSNPEPIMIRLSHHGIFSKDLKLKNIKEAILIGSCIGEMSSERAKCRLQTLSLKDKNGKIIEKNVNGWLVGEDGRIGIRGLVVDKSSDVARMAVISGLLGGMSKFMENQSTKGMYPISPISGQQNALSVSSSLKGGMYSGASNALEKLADFAIKRAEQLSPVIVVSSGRKIDVLFSRGISLLEDDELQPTSVNYNATNAEFNAQQNGIYQQNYNHVIKQINQDNLVSSSDTNPQALSDGEF